MKAIDFKESNCAYAKNQEEYITLPAYLNAKGVVVTCWKSSLVERIIFLLTGKIWLYCKTFNKPLQPLLLTTHKLEKYFKGAIK